MIELVVIVALVVLGFFALISVLGSLYRKVGPNRALIVYGRGGTKVVVGGGTVVMPLFQKADDFNLELMSFDVAPGYNLYTNQGIPVQIEAITQLKVENEDERIRRAANQFLSKRQEDRDLMVRQVMEGHLRGIVGQLTMEQLVKEPEMVSERMRDTVAADLDKLGLEVVSFTLKDVTDESGYIANMSRPQIAANKQTAEIAEAEALRNVAVKKATTVREAAEAQAQADQARVQAQTVSEAAQSEAQRDLQIRQAQYKQDVAKQQAQADVAYDIEKTVAQQRLVAEQAQVEVIQKQKQVQVQEAEASRRAAELVATVQKQAEAERQRVEIEATARAQSQKIEAEGRAAAVRTQAQADAEATKARGLADAQAKAAAIRESGTAEAEAVRLRGLAEAEALEKRVAVLNSENEIALANTALQILPAVAEKLAQAYSRIGSVTYVGGGGDGEGVTSRITRDVVGMMPAVNGMLQQVTGVNLGEIIGKRFQNGGNGNRPPTPPSELLNAQPSPEPAPFIVPAAPMEAVPTLPATSPEDGDQVT